MEKNKKIIFSLLMILLTLGCIEFMARVSYYIIFKEGYSINSFISNIKKEKKQYNRTFVEEWTEIIHPYIGFVRDYYDSESNNRYHGFSTKTPPLLRKEEGVLNVALVGGSVAETLRDFLEHELRIRSNLSPQIACFAVPGSKQPQQLMTLNYYIALGAEYDLIINVDGFNEIVLPITDNYLTGTNPFFPRAWSFRLLRHKQEKMSALWLEMRELLAAEKEVEAGMPQAFGRHSAVYGMLKWAWFKKVNNDIEKTVSKMMKQVLVKKDFEESGPATQYQDMNQLYLALAKFWKRCSILINNLAVQNGVEYYHFLQPNQYYENSKKLNKIELNTAYNTKNKYREYVVIGYPLLIDAGKELVNNNVYFVDSTMLFADVEETIYADDCCHYNIKGIEIFAQHIVSNVLAKTKINKLITSLKATINYKQ